MPAIALRRQPSSTAAPGEVFRQQPELELRGGDGKNLRQSGVAVTASLASGTGTLTGTVVVTTDNRGRARFDDLGIAGAPGSYTIRFSADGFAPTISDPVELSQATTQTSIRSDGPDPSLTGTTVSVRYQVTSAAGTTTPIRMAGPVSVARPPSGSP